MSNGKNDSNFWFIVIGLVALVLLLTKTDFFGAVVVTCDNFEPTSIQEFFNEWDDLNGTVDMTNPLTIQENNQLVQFTTYQTNSIQVGQMDIIDVHDRSCNDLLAIISQQNEGSAFLSAEERQVLLVNDRYMWCNYANTIALRSNTISTLRNYVDTFEICTEQDVQDVSDAYITNIDECIAMGGNWSDGYCYCQGERMTLGEECTAVEEESSDGREETESSYISGGTTITDNQTAPSGVSYGEPSDEDEWTSGQTIGTVLLVALFGFAMYWYFEKGPKKGLIQKRKKRSKRK